MSRDVWVRVPSCARLTPFNSLGFKGFIIYTKHIQSTFYGSADFSGWREGGVKSIVLSLHNEIRSTAQSILPEVLIDNFDINRFEKSDTRFDIWLDEKKEQLREDKYNKAIISYGFGDYRTIQDYPIRGRATYLHVRKRKWIDKSTGEIFSYEWDISEFDGTRLNAEFVAFLKEGD